MKIFKFIGQYFGYIIFITTLLTLASTWFWANGYNLVFNSLALISIFLIYPGIFFAAIKKVRDFEKHTESVKSLFVLYLEVIVTFSSIYIWIIIFSNNQAFHGFENTYIISFTKDSFILTKYFKSLFIFIVDVFHFSVVTATTLGYGDVYPKSAIAKIVVDLHVLCSLAIAIFGAGKYFELRQKDEHKVN